MGIVDLIYPKYCVGCKYEGKYVCEKCIENVRVRGKTLAYEGIIRNLLKEIKFRGSYDMVQELVDLWEEKTGGMKVVGKTVVTAVPMWRAKKRMRGFNQAELIARVLAKRWGVEYIELLARVRETQPMYGLNREQRRINIDGAFKVINIANMNKKIIMIDDVWTTGSTLSECEKELNKKGITQVQKVVLAS